MTWEELRAELFGSGTESRPEWGIVLGSGFDVWLDHLSPGERVSLLEALALAETKLKCVGVAVVANQAGSPGITHDDVLKVVRRSINSLWQPVSALIASGSD